MDHIYTISNPEHISTITNLGRLQMYGPYAYNK